MLPESVVWLLSWFICYWLASLLGLLRFKFSSDNIASIGKYDALKDCDVLETSKSLPVDTVSSQKT